MHWDQILVYLIILAAAAYLIRGFFFKKKGACGGCSNNCHVPEAKPKHSDLVQIEPGPRRQA
jgi:hypothetical protein